MWDKCYFCGDEYNVRWNYKFEKNVCKKCNGLIEQRKSVNQNIKFQYYYISKKLVKGLNPIYTKDSKVLILGTFPSKASRESNTYYANNGNRFWKVICEYFGLAVPDTYEQRLQVLNDNQIAVWDLVDTCEIEGSLDSAITNPKFNDIRELVNNTSIELVLLNGKTAFEMYEQNFKDLSVYYKLVPSTSPANATFDKNQWFESLLLITEPYKKAVAHYVKIMSNNSLYKTVNADTNPTYIFDENYGVAKTCVECGVKSFLLKECLLKEIKRGKL